MTPEERNTAWALARAREAAKDAQSAARTAVIMAALSMLAALITVWAVSAS